MGYIFYLMGKSSSGKDTIYKGLINMKGFPLKTVKGYTTRPMRSGETNGVEYHFVDNFQFNEMLDKGIIIEYRNYNTVHGVWSYFTADDGQVNLEKESYIMMGTLESYEKIRNYYGKDKLVPLYIEIEDGERLARALERERKQENPRYAEMCRRYLADLEDFKDENLEKCGIDIRYNSFSSKECTKLISSVINEKIN